MVQGPTQRVHERDGEASLRRPHNFMRNRALSLSSVDSHMHYLSGDKLHVLVAAAEVRALGPSWGPGPPAPMGSLGRWAPAPLGPWAPGLPGPLGPWAPWAPWAPGPWPLGPLGPLSLLSLHLCVYTFYVAQRGGEAEARAFRLSWPTFDQCLPPVSPDLSPVSHRRQQPIPKPAGFCGALAWPS